MVGSSLAAWVTRDLVSSDCADTEVRYGVRVTENVVSVANDTATALV